MQVYLFQYGITAFGKGQKLFSQVGRSLQCLISGFNMGIGFMVTGKLHFCKLNIPKQPCEYIVEVMGNATRQYTDGFQLFGFKEFLFCFQFFRHIPKNKHHASDIAFYIPDWSGTIGNIVLGPVF